MRMGKKLLGVGIGLLIITTAGIASRSIYTPHDPEEKEQVRATINASSGSCGVERWSVKTGTDADVGLVNLNSTTATTIATLDALTAPSTLPANNRVQPTETTQFVLSATLVEYKLESDSDYHLVIHDASGNTMIAEIPDPACVGSGSPFTAGIQSARAEFDNKYAVTTSFQTANIPVCLKGVGFFDFQHGQTGVAPNAIELHPVLDVQFNPTSCNGGGGATPPTASNGSVSTSANTAVNGTLSASGTAPLSYAIVANPAHGTVTLSNASTGAFTYTPNAGFTGSDSFSFDASNSAGTSNVATESVTVSATVSPPTASNGSVTTTAGTAVNGSLSASGTGTLSFAIVANPAHGTATLTNASTGAFTYTPASGFSGSDSFTFDASNSGGTSNVATESVTVNPAGGGNVLQNGVPATGLSAAQGQKLNFTMAVPAGATGLSFKETGGTGTPDLYVRFGAAPTTTTYDCRQYPSGGSATCAIATAQAGTYYVMMNAYTAFSGWSLTGSYSTGGGGGGGSQLIGDPGFEGGSSNVAPWTISSGVVSNSASEPPHSGSWDAWLDGYGTTHTDTASQQVTLPSSLTTATLSFWLHIDTAETGSTAYDTLTVGLYDTSGALLQTLATYSNANAASGYQQHSFDLSAYKGQTVVLKFTGTEDASNQTSFVLDDVNLNVQ